MELSGLSCSFDLFLREVSFILGMLKGSTVGPEDPENLFGTEVSSEILPVRRLLGKVQVLLGWIGQEHKMDPVGVVMMMDWCLSLCAV